MQKCPPKRKKFSVRIKSCSCFGINRYRSFHCNVAHIPVAVLACKKCLNVVMLVLVHNAAIWLGNLAADTIHVAGTRVLLLMFNLAGHIFVYRTEWCASLYLIDLCADSVPV